MKFYLASGLDNIESARFFRDGLVRAGHEQTYDWTQHGAVAAHGIERIREVAACRPCATVMAQATQLHSEADQ